MLMTKLEESNINEVDEDIEELLKLQREFINGKQKPSAICVRSNVKKNAVKREKTVTFSEKNIEETSYQKSESLKEDNIEKNNQPILSLQTSDELLVSTIYEKFTGFFECPERCAPLIFDWEKNYDMQCQDNENNEETGFPEVFDLSNYYMEENFTNKDIIHLDDNKKTKKSIFAIAFEDISNKKKLERTKVSNFKKNKDLKNAKNSSKNVTVNRIDEETPKTFENIEEKTIKNLEIIINKNDNEHSRLAIDSINSSLTSSIIKTTLPRQETNIIRLFDSLKIPSAKSVKMSVEEKKINGLCDYARSKINEIQALYLEKIQLTSDKTVLRFAKDVNPILNGAWSFAPIRRVLDAVSCRQIDASKDETENVTDDDIDICKLALLWSVLLMIERKTFFYLLSQPEEVFVRVAEIYLLGPNLFQNEIINRCISIILNKFIFKKGLENLLSFKVTASIASLDAFLPFYEDLLKRFEEYSVGNINFSLMILSVVYMNASLSDKITLAQILWMPERNVVRQIILDKKQATLILKKVKDTLEHQLEIIENMYCESYSHLLAMYAAAIRDEKITRERNPVVFEIAASEIGEFVNYYEKKETKEKLTSEKLKELDILVDLLRKSLLNKLSI